MDKVARPPHPTILEAINGAWHTRDCRGCGQPVSYEWHPRPDDPDAAWMDPSFFGRHCPDCVLAAAAALDGPPEEALERVALHQSLRERYARIRHVWITAGLWDEDAAGLYTPEQQAFKGARARDVLGITGDRWPTVTMSTWYPPGTEPGPTTPYLDTFWITGRLPAPSTADVRDDAYAAMPRFAVGERVDDGICSIWAMVYVALHAHYPPAAPATVQWRWNVLTPGISLPTTNHRMFDCAAAEFGLLASHAHRLFSEVQRRGRPRNTRRYPIGDEERFIADVEQVLANRERSGITLTKHPMLADALGMSERMLYTLFDRVPEARERFHEHQRRTPGR